MLQIRDAYQYIYEILNENFRRCKSIFGNILLARLFKSNYIGHSLAITENFGVFYTLE